MIKPLFLIFVISLSFSLSSYSQTSSVKKAEEARRRIQAYSIKISKLDEQIKHPYYLTFSFDENNRDVPVEYKERLQKANDIIEDLKDVENIFIDLVQENESEEDYYVKLAYNDLAILSICHRRDNFLGYLKFINRDEYENEIRDWEALENKHLISANTRIRKINNIDPDNLEVKIISSILHFYQNEYEQSITELKTIIADIIEIKTDPKAAENTRYDAQLSFLYSWLAYLYFYTDDIPSARDAMINARVYGQIEAEFNVLWVNETENSIDDQYKKGLKLNLDNVEMRNLFESAELCELYFTRNKKGIFIKIPYFDESNPATSKAYDKGELTIKVENPDSMLNLVPAYLIELTRKSWKELQELENKPWELVNDAFFEGEEVKKPYKPQFNIYHKYELKNSPGGEENIRNFYLHLHRFLELYNDLSYAHNGWSALIRNNPDIMFYRIMRIKAGLGIHYISSNIDYYMMILELIEDLNWTMQSTDKVKFKKYFENDALEYISDDLTKLNEKEPNSINTILCNIEVAMFTEEPSAALKKLDKYYNQLPEFAEIGGNNPLTYVEIYRSYLYFKQEDLKELKASLSILRHYPGTTKWINIIKTRLSVYEKEQFFLSNKQRSN